MVFFLAFALVVVGALGSTPLTHSSKTLKATASCFERNCSVSVTFETLDSFEDISLAALAIDIDGDLALSDQYVAIAINGANDIFGTTCELFQEAVPSCVRSTCTGDVTAAAQTGDLRVSFAISPLVEPVCGSSGYALQAEATLVCRPLSKCLHSRKKSFVRRRRCVEKGLMSRSFTLDD